MPKLKSIVIKEESHTHLVELAKAENRPLKNYLETLLERLYDDHITRKYDLARETHLPKIEL